MEIYKGKGQIDYQSNITGNKRDRRSFGVDTKGDAIDPQIILSVEAAKTSNYLNAIEAQNEKLREISWIQSHVVRSPLARIMGLIQIMGDIKDNDEIGTILEYISLSANELDIAIKQISDRSIPVLI
ncbi:MAG: hypothetical protein ACXVB0_09245 [Mucilaginibacter sp.]